MYSDSYSDSDLDSDSDSDIIRYFQHGIQPYFV